MENTNYLSFLRGINVGGKNKVPMVELRELFKALGMRDVQSYIQSGNIIFTPPDNNRKNVSKLVNRNLAEKISAGIKNEFSLSLPVLVRSEDELTSILSANPFKTEGTLDPSNLYVTLLGNNSAITKADLKPFQDSLADKAKPQEKVRLVNTNVYLYCPQVSGGYAKTKLHNAYIEKLTGITATTRNWKTLQTMGKMLEAAENNL